MTETPDTPTTPQPTTDDSKSNGLSTAVHIPSNNGHNNTSANGGTKDTSTMHQKDKPRRNPIAKCLGENVIAVATFAGVCAGIALGFGLRSARDWTPREIMYVNFPGEIFLRMLKCLILPLIVSSLVSAIGSLDKRLTGKIGFRAVAYYMSTTVLAIILGIVLVMAIRPGEGESDISQEKSEKASKPSLPEDTLMDLVRNMFPPNVMEACIKQTTSELKDPGGSNSSTGNETDYSGWTRVEKMEDGTNILGLVVISVVLGITLGEMGKKGKPLLDVFTCLSDAVMKITKIVIWFTPIGVLFLVSSKILEMKDVAQVAAQVGLYFLTVLAGVLIQGFVTLPLLYLILVRKNPFKFLVGMSQALATAFGTASSSATLPITISCLEDRNGIDPRVSRFCLPIGATINMDGTALYEAVAAIFIAQVRGVSLTLGNIIAISITATAASVGAAGIPQAGLVTMVMVLNVVGLPADDVSLILVVDWILDRFRTLINVLGDAYGAAVVAHYSKRDLKELTAKDEQQQNTEMTPL